MKPLTLSFRICCTAVLAAGMVYAGARLVLSSSGASQAGSAAAAAAVTPRGPAVAPELDIKRSGADLSLVADYPTPEERRFWTRAIKKIWLRPPCCGACSIISQDDFRTLARVMSRGSHETPETREIWNRYSAALLVAAKNQDPDLYRELCRLKGKGLEGHE